jgi:drug/metabolite transporter (DMT)-like permease
MSGILLALAASFVFALGTVLQHHEPPGAERG